MKKGYLLLTLMSLFYIQDVDALVTYNLTVLNNIKDIYPSTAFTVKAFSPNGTKITVTCNTSDCSQIMQGQTVNYQISYDETQTPGVYLSFYSPEYATINNNICVDRWDIMMNKQNAANTPPYFYIGSAVGASNFLRNNAGEAVSCHNYTS